MILIKTEFTKIDNQNDIVEITFTIDGEVHSIIQFDFKNNTTVVTGDLYNLIGWVDNDTEREKSILYSEVFRLYGYFFILKFKGGVTPDQLRTLTT